MYLRFDQTSKASRGFKAYVVHQMHIHLYKNRSFVAMIRCHNTFLIECEKAEDSDLHWYKVALLIYISPILILVTCILSMAYGKIMKAKTFLFIGHRDEQ